MDATARGRRACFARYEALDFAGALARGLELGRQLNQRIVVQSRPGSWRRTRRARPSSTRSCTGCWRRPPDRGAGLAGDAAAPRGASSRMLGLAPREPGPERLRLGPARARARRSAPIEPLFPRVEKAGAEPRAPQGDDRVRRRRRAAAARPPAETPAGRAAAGAATASTSPSSRRWSCASAQVTAAEKIAGLEEAAQAAGRPGRRARQVVAGIAERLRAGGAGRQEGRRWSRT